MSATTGPVDASWSSSHAHAKPKSGLGHFLTTYVFARDHKIIGLQFLFSTLIWFFIGGMLAMAIRWQLAWPWQSMPIVGPMLFSGEGGQISPEFYTSLVTQHATVMIFFVIIPILTAAFGNYLIPLMIGAEDMAFPTLNMCSYWMMWPAFAFIGASFFVPPFGAGAGWTSYPPLSVLTESSPGSGMAQTLWLGGVAFVGIAKKMGSVN
ncbi:MAG: cbb3-type cytochrome c oxidase subunit I [Aureliella sp.]